MTQQTYQVAQDKRSNKWIVTGTGMPIRPYQRMYLREDGTWQHVMATSWLLDGGTYFNTKNEADMALASTHQADQTSKRKEDRSRGGGHLKCHRKS